jgi:hypothetical protein
MNTADARDALLAQQPTAIGSNVLEAILEDCPHSWETATDAEFGL